MFKDTFLDSKYNLIKNLGSGAYGCIYLSESKETKEKFAIKIIELEYLSDKERQLMEQETNMLLQFNHPNIIKCYESKILENKAYIIMEYADEGDLKSLIDKNIKNKTFFQEKILLNYFIELCEAINYIHNKNIIHRDLKPNNILIMNNHIKLGDFGFARQLSIDEKFIETILGTQFYFSPEIINGKMYNKKSDIWALGIILYEIITLKYPFPKGNIMLTFQKISNGEINEIKNTNFSKELIDLIYKILKVNPDERIDIKDIILICKDILEKIKNKEENEEIEKINNINNKKNIKYTNGEYIGEIKEKKREGYGIFKYNNEDQYEGEWKNDLRNGKGVLNYKCGNIYKGEWKNDMKEGKNSIFYYNNGNIYEGDFYKNLRFGKGKMTFNNGNIYEGDFKDNEMEGNGILKMANGDFYEGEWKNGEFNGKGIYKYNNGDMYEGEFKNGNKNGKGIFIYSNGEKIEGKWENDEFRN